VGVHGAGNKSCASDWAANRIARLSAAIDQHRCEPTLASLDGKAYTQGAGAHNAQIRFQNIGHDRQEHVRNWAGLMRPDRLHDNTGLRRRAFGGNELCATALTWDRDFPIDATNPHIGRSALQMCLKFCDKQPNKRNRAKRGLMS
jgi:hypothetical protein